MTDKQNAPASNTALLTVSSSPHIKSGATTQKIMRDVLLALTPAFFWGIFVFGLNAFIMPALGVLSAVLFEYLFQRLLKKENTVGDLSAAVTGLLVGLNLPANTYWYLPVLGSAFAIVVVKGLFGGLGKNFLNPALAARVFLFLSFPTQMTTYPAPFARDVVEVVASATPRAGAEASVLDLFFGRVGGSIGEISALLLLLGGIYLLARRVISWHIPVSFLATVGLVTLLLPRHGGFLDLPFMLTELLSGGLLLGAFFMATDYVTSPVSKKGKLVFGVGCGLLTVLLRYFGSYPEGVSFAILVMNCLVFYIDEWTKPRVFGGGRHEAH